MGRIFETRKHTMFARWNRMAKQFTRIGKDITIAVRAGGPDPAYNPVLRRVIQNARAVNMPKDKVESAIKRSMGKDATNYEVLIYEGYAPHGVAVMVEAATDNPTRTIASVRSIFNKFAGKDFEDKRPRDRYVTEAKRLLGVLDKRLERRQWIMDDDYTIADVSMLGWVRNLIGFYEAKDLVGFDNFKHVAAWLERGLARPAVQRGLNIPTRPGT